MKTAEMREKEKSSAFLCITATRLIPFKSLVLLGVRPLRPTSGRPWVLNRLAVPGRLCEFNMVPVSRQKQIRWMAQRQLSGPTPSGSRRPIPHIQGNH